MPRRKIRGKMPRLRSKASVSAEWYVLSARSLLGCCLQRALHGTIRPASLS